MIPQVAGVCPAVNPISNGATPSYCGIDPGLDGAFTVISGNKIKCKLVMPTLTFKTKKGTKKREIDRAGVLSFLSKLPAHTCVAIEKQEAFRSQNITATCTTCKGYGMLLMALTATHMFATEVTSKQWHAYYGVVSVEKANGKSTKEQALEIVKDLFPNTDLRKSSRAHVASDGIVDATLLAYYCQSLFQEQNGDEEK